MSAIVGILDDEFQPLAPWGLATEGAKKFMSCALPALASVQSWPDSAQIREYFEQKVAKVTKGETGKPRSAGIRSEESRDIEDDISSRSRLGGWPQPAG